MSTKRKKHVTKAGLYFARIDERRLSLSFFPRRRAGFLSSLLKNYSRGIATIIIPFDFLHLDHIPTLQTLYASQISHGPTSTTLPVINI
jgi:hypothetical protein